MTSPRNERRLLSIQRQVAPARSAAYADAWHRLHALATARGAHAWRFRSATCDGLFLEFLEFGAEQDLRADAAVRDAIQALHAEFGDALPSPQALEEWIELPTPTVIPQ